MKIENISKEVGNRSEFQDCRGEMASRRSREARARQIARAGKPQAQDACATKKARRETKIKKTVKSNYG